MDEVGVSIYVLPTEEGKPPRAVVGKAAESGIIGPIVSWSTDNGAWIFEDGIPLPPELGDAITEHAKSLGVESFLR